jgi:rare lipoprotein A
MIAQTHRGKASYYSKRATGARTASGERLHHDSLTCAHRSYPFGTLLRVKNLSNGKEIIVKVTDRGPYGRGRIIDLSYGAARELGMLSQGVAMVEVHRVDDVTPPYRMDEGERGLPDFEFDFTETAYSFNEAWKDNEKRNERMTLPEHKLPSQKAMQDKHAANANKASQTAPADKSKNAQSASADKPKAAKVTHTEKGHKAITGASTPKKNESSNRMHANAKTKTGK